jgi:hypothetical protein
MQLHAISTRPWISNEIYICDYLVRVMYVSVVINQEENCYLQKTALELMDLLESTILNVLQEFPVHEVITELRIAIHGKLILKEPAA